MKYKTKVIVFEGMPGAGKTRTIKILKKTLGKQSIVIPQVILPSSCKDDDLTTSKKYLDAEIKKIEKIKKLENRYEYILIDRTFLTTLAYAYAHSRQNNNTNLFRKVLRYFRTVDARKHFLRPNYFFLFFVDIDESIYRRKKYAKIKKFRQWFSPTFLNQMNFFYIKYASSFDMSKPIVIDTTFAKPKEVFVEVYKHLL